MNKMWTVLRREYLSRVKTKGFIISTILTPIFLIAMSVLPSLLMFIKSDKQRQIAVIDQTGEVFDSLLVILDDKNDAGQRLYHLSKREVRPEDLDAVKKLLSEEVDKAVLDGYIVIPTTIYENGAAEYYSKSVSNFRENRRIEDAVSRAVTEIRIQRSGFESEKIRQLVRHVNLRTFRVGPGGEEQADEGFTFAIAWILVFFLYMALIIYGAVVMRSVLEEKTSRVIESVISSIKPFQLMAAKIFGVGAVGLTQFLVWAIAMGLLSLYGVQAIGLFAPHASTQNLDFPTVSLAVLAYFVLFFLLGYFLFATLYAAVGAMVNSDQEAQQMQMPVIMLIIVPIILMTFIISNPGSQASVILSLIPFFAPMIMFARIVVEMPPFWQIAASLILLALTILGCIWVVGRIYRVGVLMYGKRPTLPEIVKWIKYA